MRGNTHLIKREESACRVDVSCAPPMFRRNVLTLWLGAGRHTRRMTDRSGEAMLELITAVLVILWVLGFATSTTMNGFLHILIVIAVVIILVRVIGGRKPV